MKFGKRLNYLIPDHWKDGAVDYKGLKRLIKLLIPTSVQDASDRKTHAIATFRQALLTEMNKVNDFFNQELNYIETTSLQDTLHQEKQIRDGLDEPTPLQMLQQLMHLSENVDALRRFAVINFLGFIKALKKFDKHVHSHLGQEMLPTLHQQFFTVSPETDTLYSDTAALTDRVMRMYYPEFANTLTDSSTWKSSCPICLNPNSNPITLNCQHTFCWTCLSQAREHEFDTCPVCRAAVSLDPRDYGVDGLVKRFLIKYSQLQRIASPDSKRKALQAAHIQIVKMANEIVDHIRFQHSVQPIASGRRLSKSTSNEGKDAYKPLRAISIGHQGAAGHKKANTLDSFEEAIRLGVQMIQVDIQQCASGELLSYHEILLNTGSFIRELTLDQVVLEDPSIPTIEQVLDLVNKRTAIYFNLKDEYCIPALMKILKKRCLEENWEASAFLIASFNHYQLIAVNSYRSPGSALEHLQTVVLTSSIPLGYTKSFEQIGISYVSIDYSIVNAQFIADAHKRGIRVFVWTINQLPCMAKMLDLHVDGLISDFPDFALHAIKTYPHIPLTTKSVAAPSLKASGVQAQINYYKPGDAVEIVSLHDPAKWYPGVIVGCNNGESLPTYSVLWWVTDNSQRRASNVACSQLRPPSTSDAFCNMSPLMTAAADCLRLAAEWTAYPIIDGIRSSFSRRASRS